MDYMTRRRKCYICGKLKYPNEHYKKCYLDLHKIYICSMDCWEEYIEEWKKRKS